MSTKVKPWLKPIITDPEDTTSMTKAQHDLVAGRRRSPLTWVPFEANYNMFGGGARPHGRTQGPIFDDSWKHGVVIGGPR